MDEDSKNIRFHIFQFYLENCHPPSVEELGKLASLSSERVENALRVLEEERHLVLYREGVASPTPIAMVHPFSHLPTSYIVIQGRKSWWANCAWCSFGLASMLSPEDGKIYIQARSGSIGKEIHFEITNGFLLTGVDRYFVVHFSLPPPRWWDDVRFTCSTIQLFESETESEEWCKTRGFPKGAIISLGAMWELGKVWYSDKANVEYKRKSPAEAEALFAQLGLTDSFWRVTDQETFR